MDTRYNPDRRHSDERPDPARLAPGYGHLLLHDTRTPEEQLAASLKQSARRKGRGRSRWWEKGGE